MDNEQDGLMEENKRSEQVEINTQDSHESNIGKGKKTGLYGCAFIILGIIIFFIVLSFTGYYTPFQGSEGVGP